MSNQRLLEQLDTITTHFENNRRAGSTTAMMKGVLRDDEAIIVAYNHQVKDAIEQEWGAKNVVNLQNPNALRGRTGRMVLDNCTVGFLLKDAAGAIRRLETEVAAMKERNQGAIQRLEEEIEAMRKLNQ